MIWCNAITTIYTDFRTNYMQIHQYKKEHMNAVKEWEIVKASKLQAHHLLNDKLLSKSDFMLIQLSILKCVVIVLIWESVGDNKMVLTKLCHDLSWLCLIYIFNWDDSWFYFWRTLLGLFYNLMMRIYPWNTPLCKKT